MKPPLTKLVSANCTIEVEKCQKLVGSVDCGYLLLVEQQLCFGENPALTVFDQNKMRSHL